jgi:uncharacterized integral membrane protein (TIGR00697 family)
MTTMLVGLYVACDLISNVTAGKPVAVAGIVVPAAVFLYTLTFTLIDLINERLGKAGARQVVATAFAANLLLAGYVQFAIWLPAAPFYRDAGAFAGVLGGTPRIVLASLVAYLASSLVDTEIFAWWRARVGGPKWARVLTSNAVSTLVDSVLFITIAFAGALPVWPLIGGQYLVKMGVTLVSLPLIYATRGSGQPSAIGCQPRNSRVVG